ncbi:MAG: hypothetical protein NC033_03500 [Clostridiales bacterium]|nr:hypothetical protein [Clostridiales bacterium]
MIDERTDEKQTEIIAEKSRVKAYVFLALAVFGVALAAAGIILFAASGFNLVTVSMQAVTVSLTAAGGLVLIVFSMLFIKQLYRPYALITLTDGVLKFSDGAACSPNDITAVEKSKNKITLTVNGEKKEIAGVADADKAYRKLCVLTGNAAVD